jgi:cephalosporin-C deacetylase-like acetyl esterase
MSNLSSGLARARRIVAVFGVLVFVLQPSAVVGRQQQAQPRPPLIAYLDSVAQSHLKERADAVSRIQTRADAERRRAEVRQKVLRLIGGLPTARRPPAVRRFGTLNEDGFRVEKLAYESLPGFLVTANVYVPTASRGPFPAVILTPGHDPRGKLGQYSWGANLARAGVVALAYDPISEGERFQNYDPELGASKVGGVTGEHSHADVQTLLIGEHVSRYFVWDAMRAIDYLASRGDVDAERVGAFGCSGGGTVTAYLAALDDRIKAAATACYITSMDELLAAPTGPQEAEQTLPSFIAEGLDFADWVEAAAPKPYAIVSTTEDMFPFAGARKTFEEAKRVYGLYGAAERLQWITGPGGHGALGPVSSDILSFFTRWLKGDNTKQTFTPARPRRPEDLLCTPTGQLSDSVGSETVFSLNRKRAAELLPAKRALTTRAELERLQARLRTDVRATAAVSAQPGATPPAVNVTGTTQRTGYRLDAVTMHTDDGLELAGLLAVPERAGAKRALLMLDSRAKENVAAAGGEVERLAQAGWLVFVLQPRATPLWTEELKSPLLGNYYLLSLRARLVGKTIVGMRADDIIRAVDWLAAREDVDRTRIDAYGNGPEGVALLHAAALDTRITRVFVENTLASYRLAVERPIHRNLPEVALPGVLTRYDIGDLLLAISPRPVVFINPTNNVGTTMREADATRELGYVLDTDRALGTTARVRLAWRSFGEPLPVE